MEAFIAWWPIVFFPADKGNFNKGFTATIILGALVIITVAGIWVLDRQTRYVFTERQIIYDEHLLISLPEKAGSSPSRQAWRRTRRILGNCKRSLLRRLHRFKNVRYDRSYLLTYLSPDAQVFSPAAFWECNPVCGSI